MEERIPSGFFFRIMAKCTEQQLSMLWRQLMNRPSNSGMLGC